MAITGPGITPYGRHVGQVYAVAYAPDGATLATGGDDGTVRLWRARTGRQKDRLTGHTGPVRAVAFAPDGTTLATGGGDDTVRLWRARTGQRREQLTGHTGPVRAVAYAPDGATLATGDDDGTVRLWDTRTGRQKDRLTGHTGPVRAVAFAPDGTTLATGGGDDTVRLWDARTGQQQDQLTGPVRAVAYAPDGTTLATGDDDDTVRLWDTRTGQLQDLLTGHTGPVRAVAYAPDGTTLATGDDDGTVRLWDTRTGQLQDLLTGHTGPVRAVAYAPDGTTLATGGDDGTVRLWDTRTGQQQRELTGWVRSRSRQVRDQSFIVFGLVAAGGAAVILWFFSNPEGLSSQAAASDLVTFAVRTLTLSAVAGFAAMATLEVLKRLLHLRGWFFLGRIAELKFLRPAATAEAAVTANRGLLSRWPRARRFDIPLEQLMAQLSYAGDQALDELLTSSADHGRAFLATLLGEASLRRAQASPSSTSGEYDLTRLRVETQAALDDVQANVGNAWRWRLRLTSCVLAALFGLAALIYVPVPPGSKLAALVGSFLIGGFFAGFFRDLAALVERFRRL